MSESEKRWIPYEERAAHDFTDEPALACYLGKVWYFHYGRNAWNWTWTNKYPGSQAFHPTFDSCRAAIEAQRVQGSTWRMREMPAVVIAGKDDAIIVTEINTETPLKDFVAVDYGDKTLASIADCFQPRRENSVIRFITYRQTIGPAELPFKGQKSYTRGPKSMYYLGWLPEQEKRDFASAFEVVKAVNIRLQKQ